MNFKLSISRATKAPTADEELLKLDLLEACKKQQNTFSLYDDVLIAFKKRGMQHSHKAIIPEGSNYIVVSRKYCDSTILKLEPSKVN